MVHVRQASVDDMSAIDSREKWSGRLERARWAILSSRATKGRYVPR